MKKIHGLILTLIICSLGCASVARADSADNFAQQQFGMSFDQIKKEAAQGDPDAEYALGYMFYYGKGTPRDEESARMWINKAAAQGQSQAIQAQQMLAQTQQSGQASINAAPNAAVKSDSTSPIASSKPSLAKNPPASSPATLDTTGPADMPGDTAMTNVANGSAHSAVAKGEMAAAASTEVASDSKEIIKKHFEKAKHNKEVAEKSHHETSNSTVATSLSEKKLMHAPAHYYTIQIVASHNQTEIMDFIRLHHLQKEALYYRSRFQGKPWYILVYGIYPSDTAAEAALARLPESVRKSNPWPRTIGSVQTSISKRQG